MNKENHKSFGLLRNLRSFLKTQKYCKNFRGIILPVNRENCFCNMPKIRSWFEWIYYKSIQWWRTDFLNLDLLRKNNHCNLSKLIKTLKHMTVNLKLKYSIKTFSVEIIRKNYINFPSNFGKYYIYKYVLTMFSARKTVFRMNCKVMINLKSSYFTKRGNFPDFLQLFLIINPHQLKQNLIRWHDTQFMLK